MNIDSKVYITAGITEILAAIILLIVYKLTNYSFILYTVSITLIMIAICNIASGLITHLLYKKHSYYIDNM
jgi:VIT1/CCC1 family predicted Fe2+/Mn2+ transporter